jgi:hypothetical protein
MGATETVDWKDTARLMRAQGKPEREIAEALGKSRSTIHETVKDVAPLNGVELASVDATALARAAGLEDDRAEARATPGQQTIDGGEVPADPQPPVQEIVMRGTAPLDFFNAGGKLPNKATVRFVGGKVGLEQGTAFKKADVIHFEGYATVVAATPRDKRDKATGVVLECELQIQAEIDDLSLRTAD